MERFKSGEENLKINKIFNRERVELSKGKGDIMRVGDPGYDASWIS